MARTRRDDDFDDEDYEPRPRRQRDSGGNTAFPYMLFGILGLGGLVVAGLFVFVIGRTRNAMERATEQVAAEREAAIARLPQPALQRRAPENTQPGANWAKMVGTWARQPAGNDDTGYPYQFEFRNDLTCTTTRVNGDGQPIRQESRVEVVSGEGDSVRLALHVHMGTYSYPFQLKPDGTLVLDNGKGGLVFTRVK